jgi:hypothetical protein
MIFWVYQVFESSMYFRATTEGKLKCTLDTFCLQFTIFCWIFLKGCSPSYMLFDIVQLFRNTGVEIIMVAYFLCVKIWQYIVQSSLKIIMNISLTNKDIIKRIQREQKILPLRFWNFWELPKNKMFVLVNKNVHIWVFVLFLMFASFVLL